MRAKCKICDYEWTTRKGKPAKCASQKCRSKMWETGEPVGPELSDETLLKSPTYGGLLLTILYIHTHGRRYAELLGKTHATISSQIKRLQSRGFVKKIKNSKTQTRKRVFETTEGAVSKFLHNYLSDKIIKERDDMIHRIKKGDERREKTAITMQVGTYATGEWDQNQETKIVELSEEDRKKTEKRSYEREKKNLTQIQNKLLDEINQKTEQELTEINRLFAPGVFEGFVGMYWEAMWPNNDISLMQFLDIYLRCEKR